MRKWSRLDGWIKVFCEESAIVSWALPGRKMEESIMFSCQLSLCWTFSSQSDGCGLIGEGGDGVEAGGGERCGGGGAAEGMKDWEEPGVGADGVVEGRLLGRVVRLGGGEREGGGGRCGGASVRRGLRRLTWQTKVFVVLSLRTT